MKPSHTSIAYCPKLIITNALEEKFLVFFSQQCEKELLVVPRGFLGNSMLKKNTVSLVVNL